MCPMALPHQGHWGSIHLSSLVDAVGLWVSFLKKIDTSIFHNRISQFYMFIFLVRYMGHMFFFLCVCDFASPELIFKTLGGRK